MHIKLISIKPSNYNSYVRTTKKQNEELYDLMAIKKLFKSDEEWKKILTRTVPYTERGRNRDGRKLRIFD